MSGRWFTTTPLGFEIQTRTGARTVYVIAQLTMGGKSAMLTADGWRQFWWAYWTPNAVRCQNLTLSDENTPRYIRDAFDAFCRHMVAA